MPTVAEDIASRLRGLGIRRLFGAAGVGPHLQPFASWGQAERSRASL